MENKFSFLNLIFGLGLILVLGISIFNFWELKEAKQTLSNWRQSIIFSSPETDLKVSLPSAQYLRNSLLLKIEEEKLIVFDADSGKEYSVFIAPYTRLTVLDTAKKIWKERAISKNDLKVNDWLEVTAPDYINLNDDKEFIAEKITAIR
jgi:hypothetical protein